MTAGEKIETINNKFKQNKGQYNLARQTVKIFTLSSRKVSKYEFLTGEDVLLEKELLEKSAAIKRFEYSPLGNELKKQASITEKQYGKLGNPLEFYEQKEDKRKNKRSRGKSNLVCSNYFIFYNYHNIKEFAKRSFDSKRKELIEFKDKL